MRVAEPLQLEVTVNKVPYAPIEPTPADPELAPATLKDVRLKFDPLEAKQESLLLRMNDLESAMAWEREQYKNGYYRLPLPKPGEDIGQMVNDVIADMEKRFQPFSKHIVLPNGIWEIRTPIILEQTIVGKRIVLEGSGHLATTLVMPFGPEHHFIGIDARNSRECHIRNLRVIEDVGDPVDRCCCIAVGGTSTKVTDCWFGNAKIGILTTGAGSLLANNFIEHCQVGLLVATRYFDESLGIQPATANTRDLTVATQYQYYAPTTIRNHLHLHVETKKGKVKTGDTLKSDGFEVPILDVYEDRVLLVNRVDALNEDGKPIGPGEFETSSGATGKITVRRGNLLSNIDIHLMSKGQHRNGKPVLTAEGAEHLTLKLKANDTNGALYRHVRPHDITAMMIDSLSPTRMEKCVGLEPRYMDPNFPEIEVR